MSQQALRFNGSAILSIIFVCIIVYAVYTFYPSADNSEEVLLRNKLPVEPGSNVLKMEESWETLKEKLMHDTSLIIKEQDVTINGNPLFYREAQPPNGAKPQGTILLLHGQAFKSLTWHELGTLHFLSKNGFRAVAVDLPGYGNTKLFKTDNKADFMMDLLKALGMSDPAIIVSPSMSGGFALPLLFSHPEVFKGYVPVAPVGTGSYTSEEYKNLKVPTCIIYGENDKSLGQTSLSHLSQIPNNEIHMLPGAGHPAYLDLPKEFHEYLLSFANRLFEAKL